jgi:two-component system, sensor histidine kinase and response regulator
MLAASGSNMLPFNASILVVDDNPMNLDVLEIGLSQYGYSVKAVKDGRSTYEAIAAAVPDLILLDILLPDTDGYTVCRELKSDKRFCDIPVIFISALHDTIDKLKGFEVGAVDYLAKPLDFDEVLARTNAHVTLYRQRKAIEQLLAEREQLMTQEREQRIMLAVAQERERLARDLHDSLTQTLFSINSIVEAIPRIYIKKPDKAQEYFLQLSTLTRGAMAEMRILLVELRADLLAQSRLGQLLKQLADAFSGKTNIPVQIEVDEDFVLSPEVQNAVYRIAQEALNNIDKHAHATHVVLSFVRVDNRVELRVQDNGVGFHPSEVPAGHFGIRFMYERAEQINAVLTITSNPLQGTCLILRTNY